MCNVTVSESQGCANEWTNDYEAQGPSRPLLPLSPVMTSLLVFLPGRAIFGPVYLHDMSCVSD